jgi:hypothetical protein
VDKFTQDLVRDLKKLTDVAQAELIKYGVPNEIGQSLWQPNNSDHEVRKSVYHVLREEYETWALLDHLNVADRTHFSSIDVDRVNHCPRTQQVYTLVREHLSLTVHAVADWLE